ncbi:MAG: virion protein [Gammaproteobacteria bacterium]|nr:virion protein [Gammaproteobacteria bacterium]
MAFVFKDNRPRGFRNKNPGNIKYNASNDWVGQIGQDSKGFVIFESFEFGIRAIGKVLDTKALRGLTSIGQIIPDYAPAEDANDVDAYIQSVENSTGIHRDTPLSRLDYPNFIAAIILHENGEQPFTKQFVVGALSIA